MKSSLLLLIATGFAVLFTGYYNAIEDAEIHTQIFIKKHPTLKIKFINIHANNADHKPLEKLTPQERIWVIDYCKYRLGIETPLKTEKEFRACQRE